MCISNNCHMFVEMLYTVSVGLTALLALFCIVLL